MATAPSSKSADVRARLNHPVIDSDGHTVEFEPAFVDCLKEVGGTAVAERYHNRRDSRDVFRWYALSPEERRAQRATRPPWWGLPTRNTLDRATATLPKLLYERLDEMGMDFTVDDWWRCGIEKAEDIQALFVPHFYFGCEADDPLNASAFNTTVNPFGAKLKAVFSSDIGHWDVPDMRDVVREAHEGVEKGLLTEADFRDFVFTNPVTLWTGMNPDFFKGTVVESQVNRWLAEAAQ